MSDFIEIPEAINVNDGQMREVSVSGRELLIARAKGKYYVADNRCPHFGGRLSHGKLEDTVVTCPMHGSQFDLSDGHVIRWTNWLGLKASISRMLKSPRALKVYQTRTENGHLMVNI